MAIGRISGAMLYSNLDRQGIDLQVDTDLAYFDVANRRLGIGTTSPAQSLDAPGNVRLANLSILGNTIISNTGRIGLGSVSNITITGGLSNYVLATDGAGNLSFVSISDDAAVRALRANITAANAAIVTANSSVISYVNYLNSAMAANIIAANVTASANVIAANAAIVTANTNLKNYTDAQITSVTNAWQLNSLIQENQINELRTDITAANAAIVTANTGVVNYINYQISSTYSNAAMQEAEISALRANVNAANLTISVINANINSYKLYANANIGSIYNHLNLLDANVGSYESYANLSISSLQSNIKAANLVIATLVSEVYSNANVASYLPTYSGNIQFANVAWNTHVDTATNNIQYYVGLYNQQSGNLKSYASGGTLVYNPQTSVLSTTEVDVNILKANIVDLYNNSLLDSNRLVLQTGNTVNGGSLTSEILGINSSSITKWNNISDTGSVSVGYFNRFKKSTITNAVSPVTYGDLATVYIDGSVLVDPSDGTNITVTNGTWGLYSVGGIKTNANLTAGGNLTVNGDATFGGQVSITNLNIVGNVSPSSVYSTFYGNIHTNNIFSFTDGNINLQPNAGGVVTTVNAAAFQFPVGDNLARPASPQVGYFRYNTQSGSLEFYDGSEWINTIGSVKDQQLVGDNISVDFPLDYFATASTILVSINGTLQQPGYSYSVSDQTITFKEAPLSTDQVDIRFVASQTGVDFSNQIVQATPISVNQVATIIESFSTSSFRSGKYIISGTIGTDAHAAEVLLLQNNGFAYITTHGIINTGSNSIVYTANINGSTVNLLANATASPTSIRIQKTLFSV